MRFEAWGLIGSRISEALESPFGGGTQQDDEVSRVQPGKLRGQDWRFSGKFLYPQDQGDISSCNPGLRTMVIVHTSPVPSEGPS